MGIGRLPHTETKIKLWARTSIVALMDAGGSLVGDVHSNGADIDSLLSNDADVDKTRRLPEPYERHRAHDLRAECYRRGLRPIKKGPNANDNKNGYILLLRKDDGSTNGSNMQPPLRDDQMDKRSEEDDDDDDSATGTSDADAHTVNSLVKTRQLPNNQSHAQGQGQGQGETATPTATELQGFYDGAQPNMVPVLPMQYAAPSSNLPKPTGSANPTTDLEILSGIANSYTQNVTTEGQLCGSCRTVVTDQLMESIRLGKTKMQLQEYHKLTDQRDRDTLHLKEVLGILGNLRKAYREAQEEGMNHEVLIELQDDMAFFRTLKERTKQRMRHEMQKARERANKSNASA